MSKVSINLDGLKKLQEQLKKVDRKQLQVGWFESARYTDGTPVAGIAALQEYGSAKGGIPARSFMRPTVEDKRKEWAKLASDGFGAFIYGKVTPENVLNAIGLKAVGDIKNTITTSSYPALSPITIALRGLKNKGYKVNGSLVGAVAAAIARGETGPGQLGDQSFGNKDPLRDSGILLATLTHEVS